MINEDCKVSIITVVYNGVKTIEQTIQSVLGQTYKNIEYIIIDGASTDGTQQVIEKYAGYLGYYVSEPDDGLYYAMNKGIERATGDIIGIINSDDWYAEDAVAEVVKCFEENDVEWIFGKQITVSGTNEEKLSDEYDIEERIWYQMVIPHPTMFVKKCVYDRLGTFDTKYRVTSDYELVLRFLSEGVRFSRIDNVLAYFRRGGISTTNGKAVCDDWYKISMNYIYKCPYKDKVFPKIKEQHRWACFTEAILNERNALHQSLNGYFQTHINSIIIFGTGMWGKRCSEILKNSGVEFLCFVDNNTSKWDTEFQGIKVINPDELKSMEAYVLIAVKESGGAIKKQLTDMGNSGLKYVTIAELMMLYCEQNRL